MFENISIGIKTFLRDEQLFNTIQAIRTNLPGAQMLIADCGEMTDEKDSLYAELERDGHIHIDLPFDAGFGAMSNAIADRLTRPRLLVGSDDFDFSTNEAAQGIFRLQGVLDCDPNIDVASGRVNNNPYEFILIDEGDTVTEIPADIDPTVWYQQVDLTVNYSLFRKEVFDKVRWESDIKIGGAEHGAQFVKLKRAGFKTVFVNYVNINEQAIPSRPRYRMYRRRAADPSRPCFDRIGVKKYILGNGVVDYDETQGGANAVR